MDPNTAAGVTFLLSVVSIIVSVVTLVLQRRLSIEIHTKESALQQGIHEREATLQRRTSFFELWPHVAHLSDVNPSNPVQADVIKGVNALEMMAVCWEANVVDRHLIRVAMLDGYLKMYDRISQIGVKLPNGKTGSEILRESPVVGKIYGELQALKHSQAVIPQ